MAQDRIPFKKIYIDSKYATSDSISTSNFRVQLPQTCQLPDNCVFFIYVMCVYHIVGKLSKKVITIHYTL